MHAVALHMECVYCGRECHALLLVSQPQDFLRFIPTTAGLELRRRAGGRLLTFDTHVSTRLQAIDSLVGTTTKCVSTDNSRASNPQLFCRIGGRDGEGMVRDADC